MSEWRCDGGGRRSGTAAVSVSLVYKCLVCPCINRSVRVCCGCVLPGLRRRRPLRRRRGFATAVMDLVSVHRLSLDLGRQAGGLAGDHVLLLLAHQPVLHRALGRRRDVTGQPALVPLVEALVLAGRHSVLRLLEKEGGERGNHQSLVHASHSRTRPQLKRTFLDLTRAPLRYM